MEGHALLVGVNELTVGNEHTHRRDLCSAKLNTSKVKELIDLTNIKYSGPIIPCHDKQAEWSFVSAELDRLKKETDAYPGDSYVFLYFFGHCMTLNFFHDQVPTQFLCFKDRKVHENEIRKKLDAFNSRCRIFVVLDACYSEGIAIPLELKSELGIQSVSKDFYDDYIKNIAFYNNEIENNQQADFINEKNTVFLCACGKDQVVMNSPLCNELSPFTKHFYSAWSFLRKSNLQPKNYSFLFDLLKKEHRLTKYYPETITTPFFINTYPLIFK